VSLFSLYRTWPRVENGPLKFLSALLKKRVTEGAALWAATRRDGAAPFALRAERRAAETLPAGAAARRGPPDGNLT